MLVTARPVPTFPLAGWGICSRRLAAECECDLLDTGSDSASRERTFLVRVHYGAWEAHLSRV